MKRFPITLNYDDRVPIGFVEIDDEVVVEAVLQESVLGPLLKSESGPGNYKVVSYGLILRTQVDTRPRQ